VQRACSAVPYDLEETELGEYKNLNPRWHDWRTVKAACAQVATVIFDRVCDLDVASADPSPAPIQQNDPRRLGPPRVS